MEIYIVKQDILFAPETMYEDALDVDLGAYSTYEAAVEAIKKYDPLKFGTGSKKYSIYNSSNSFTKVGYFKNPNFCITVHVCREPLLLNEKLDCTSPYL